MRESIGATFLIKLMIVFIFFFASFLAIAINYSQAFRIKNEIISALEKYEGYNTNSQVIIGSVVNGSGYYRQVNCNGSHVIKARDNDNKVINGVCVWMSDPGESNKVYYKVTTYVSFNFPIFGNIFTFPVVGETKTITNNNSSSDFDY